MDDETNPSNPTQFWIDVFSLLAFLAGIFATLWMPEHSEPRYVFALVLLVLGASAWRNRTANRELFEAHSPSKQTTGQLVIFTIAAGAVLLAVCHFTGAHRGNFFAAFLDKSASEWLTVKIPTVIWQQLMLQLLLAPILLRLFRKVSVAVVAGASVFALIHLPNPLLMCLTLIAGLVWMSSFYASRKLGPIVVSHVVLAILAAGFCGEYVLNMRVGARCLSMLPQQVESDSGPIYEFPLCVAGSALRITQTGDQLTIEGWVYDGIHHTCPESLSVMVNNRLRKFDDVHFESASIERWPDLSSSEFVADKCSAFIARIPVSQTEFHNTDEMGATTPFKPKEFRLFATNLNGHVAELGRLGTFVASPVAISDRTIVLFPVELDGRIDWVGQRDGQIHLRGWATDLKATSLADEICIETNGKIDFISLSDHRLRRPAIAEALKQPRFLDCGFEIPVADLDLQALDQVRIYAVDQRKHLHPLKLTERVRERIANKTGTDGRTLR